MWPICQSRMSELTLPELKAVLVATPSRGAGSAVLRLRKPLPKGEPRGGGSIRSSSSLGTPKKSCRSVVRSTASCWYLPEMRKSSSRSCTNWPDDAAASPAKRAADVENFLMCSKAMAKSKASNTTRLRRSRSSMLGCAGSCKRSSPKFSCASCDVMVVSALSRLFSPKPKASNLVSRSDRSERWSESAKAWWPLSTSSSVRKRWVVTPPGAAIWLPIAPAPTCA
mmetsp:Transcript_529/g.1917  ORF Transcript_529/g.1917 Transcript_529/m.1917 type:complete len:225 (-) Transcript_529:67-741(-)